MKRYIVLIFFILLIFALAGCGTEDVSSGTQNESQFETNSEWEPWQ